MQLWYFFLFFFFCHQGRRMDRVMIFRKDPSLSMCVRIFSLFTVWTPITILLWPDAPYFVLATRSNWSSCSKRGACSYCHAPVRETGWIWRRWWMTFRLERRVTWARSSGTLWACWVAGCCLRAMSWNGLMDTSPILHKAATSSPHLFLWLVLYPRSSCQQSTSSPFPKSRCIFCTAAIVHEFTPYRLSPHDRKTDDLSWAI